MNGVFDWRAVDERAIGSKVKDRNEETEARSCLLYTSDAADDPRVV